MHTTNSTNLFIEIAEDCPAQQGQAPPLKGAKKTVANYEFELLQDAPYRYTSDEVIFEVFAQRKGIVEADREQRRAEFFSKGQPCFRASPLTKKYGWGVHHNAESKIAIYGVDSAEYQQFVADQSLAKKKAMRSKKA